MTAKIVNTCNLREVELIRNHGVTIGRSIEVDFVDKRVSRKHATLTFIPGRGVKLEALHVNPCFVMVNGSPPIEIVKKGNEKLLQDGDYLGLVQDRHWYKINLPALITENGVGNSSFQSSPSLNDISVQLKSEHKTDPEEVFPSDAFRSLSPDEFLRSRTPPTPDGVVRPETPPKSTAVSASGTPPTPDGVLRPETPPTPDGILRSETPPKPPAVSAPGTPPTPDGLLRPQTPPTPDGVLRCGTPPPPGGVSAPGTPPTPDGVLESPSPLTRVNVPVPSPSSSINAETRLVSNITVVNTEKLLEKTRSPSVPPDDAELEENVQSVVAPSSPSLYEAVVNTEKLLEKTKSPSVPPDDAELEENVQSVVAPSSPSLYESVDKSQENVTGSSNLVKIKREPEWGEESSPAKRRTLNVDPAGSTSTSINLPDALSVKTERTSDLPDNTSATCSTTTANAPPASRPLCQYEGGCYRKNAQHKADFCHPNDPDWLPLEARPLCPYDRLCYRNSRAHRVNMRHTSNTINTNPPPPTVILVPLMNRPRPRYPTDSEYDSSFGSDNDLDFEGDEEDDEDYIPPTSQEQEE